MSLFIVLFCVYGRQSIRDIINPFIIRQPLIRIARLVAFGAKVEFRNLPYAGVRYFDRGVAAGGL